MTPIKSRPLIDQEIEELDVFLLSDDGLENAMDVSGLDGFLCAVLSGPNVRPVVSVGRYEKNAAGYDPDGFQAHAGSPGDFDDRVAQVGGPSAALRLTRGGHSAPRSGST